MPNDQRCGDCNLDGLNSHTLGLHLGGKKHLEHVGMTAVVVEDRVFPDDLQAVIDAYDMDPRDRAKMLRSAFSTRGWPDETHPGSVRDFMVEQSIPFFDVPDHVTFADGKNYSNAAAKEIIRTGSFNPNKETDGNKAKNPK